MHENQKKRSHPKQGEPQEKPFPSTFDYEIACPCLENIACFPCKLEKLARQTHEEAQFKMIIWQKYQETGTTDQLRAIEELTERHNQLFNLCG